MWSSDGPWAGWAAWGWGDVVRRVHGLVELDGHGPFRDAVVGELEFGDAPWVGLVGLGPGEGLAGSMQVLK
jgi:hypothetical protein